MIGWEVTADGVVTNFSGGGGGGGSETCQDRSGRGQLPGVGTWSGLVLPLEDETLAFYFIFVNLVTWESCDVTDLGCDASREWVSG